MLILGQYQREDGVTWIERKQVSVRMKSLTDSVFLMLRYFEIGTFNEGAFCQFIHFKLN